MPLAILLQEQLAALGKGVKSVDGWATATDMFGRIVTRLRSAYLVRWFGSSLPLQGLALVVAITNVDELRKRFNAVGGGARVQTPESGPNLFEPLLGLGGTMLGAVASPINALMFSTTAAMVVQGATSKAIAVVNWLSGGTLAPGLLVGAGALGGLGMVGALPVWAAGSGSETFDLLGGLAELAKPLQAFFDQVSGDRARVRNPLLRAGLDVGDAVGRLAIAMLGLFAVLVTRIAPALGPLRARLLAAYEIAIEVMRVIGFVITSALELIAQLTSKPGSVPDMLKRGLSRLAGDLSWLGAALAETALRFGAALKRFLGRGPDVAAWWRSKGAPHMRRNTTEHPLLLHLGAFADQLGTLLSGERGTVMKVIVWIADTVHTMPAALPPAPSGMLTPGLLPSRWIVPLARAARKANPDGLANPLALSPRAMGALTAAKHPPSVFRGQRAILHRAEHKRGVATRAQAADVYLDLAKRLISPKAAEYVRKLEGKLVALDGSLRQQHRLPVKDLPRPTHLRPRIRVLRVRASGYEPQALQAWTADLRRELNATPYPIAARG